MDERYRDLGFNMPMCVKNPYGIKIFVGTSGKDDWGVKVPKGLVVKKFLMEKSNGADMYSSYTQMEHISEEKALSVAQEWTLFAKVIWGNKSRPGKRRF